MAHRQQKLIYCHSRDWKTQDQCARKFGVWWGHTSWCIDLYHLAVSSQGGINLSTLRPTRALIILMKSPPLQPNHLAEVPYFNNIVFMIKFQHMILRIGKHPDHCSRWCPYSVKFYSDITVMQTYIFAHLTNICQVPFRCYTITINKY
jgi:hypothetical protein